jgi:hypothetical protein
MLENVGYAGSSGLITGLIVLVAIIPTVFLQWRGKMTRNAVPERAPMS